MSNNKDNEEKELLNIIEGIIGEKDIGLDLDTKIIESGLIDSLKLLYLISEIESKFNFTFNINNIDIDDFETPQKMLTLIYDMLNN